MERELDDADPDRAGDAARHEGRDAARHEGRDPVAAEGREAAHEAHRDVERQLAPVTRARRARVQATSVDEARLAPGVLARTAPGAKRER